MSLLPAGNHGGDGARLAAVLGRAVADVLDLSASLNPAAGDPVPLLAPHLGAVSRYPDDRRATAALAETLDVDPARVVLTNGGAEAIALVAAVHPTGWAALDEFGLYRRHLTTLDVSGPRWVSDPHNPTGRLAPPSERAFVRDEAFYVLATGEWSRHDPDTFVVGSLTKAFACPGLRIGYVVCPDPIAARDVAARRPQWSVNGLAVSALPDLLASAEPTRWHATVTALRTALVGVLSMHGHRTVPSAANYVWIPEAGGLRDRLMHEGILIRSGASFGSPTAARIAVPSQSGLERLSDGLDRTEARR